MKKNLIVCLSGPSGVGKTSYAKKLAEKHRFIQPKIVTTRDKRLDDGSNYMYVSVEQFLVMVNNGQLIEWDRYLDCYYGTLLQDFNDALATSSVNGVVLDLTPQGCNLIKKNHPSAIVIALLPDDSDWLVKRLNNRNSQSQEEIRRRTAILKECIDELKTLSCDSVFTKYSENSWDTTFEEIERIVFR